MKRRVQAQRKFAQGVSLPLSAQSVPEPTAPSLPTPARDSRLIQTKISVSTLLDVVSYRSIHTHKVPVVVLERLVNKDSIRTRDQKPKKETLTTLKVISPKNAKLTKATSLNSSKANVVLNKKSFMRLRPRATLQHKFIKSNKRGLKSRPKTTRLPVHLPARKVVRKKTIDGVASSDDERPLKYFKIAREKPGESYAKESSFIFDPVNPREGHGLTNIDFVEHIKDEKSVHNESPSIIGEDLQSTLLYGDKGIEQWIEGQSASNEWELLNRNGSLFSASQIPPVQEMPTTEKLNSDSTITNNGLVYSCVANSQGNGCQQCTHCQVANKCKTLRERFSINMSYSGAESQGATTDVYNFDEDCDDAPPPQGSYQPRKQRPPSAVAKDSLKMSYGAENKLYFDIFPPHVPQMIELTPVKIANSKNCLMKARLIPRSDCPEQHKKMSLVEHEILLDELLQMIPQPDQAYSADNFKTPNPPETKCITPKIKGTKKTPSPCSNTESAVLAPLPKTAASKTSKAGAAQVPESEPSEPSPSIQPPQMVESAKLLDAPTYYLTEKEFNDPIAFFEKVMPAAAKYGLCKVVAPKSFKPTCVLDESINFNVSNQYIARLYSRWGPCAREMAAIKACLSTQGVKFRRPPLMGGVELSLPELYTTVQEHGGFNEVNEKKRWNKVSEAMGYSHITNPERRLDSIYVKYLVPYETLSHQEREQIKNSVEAAWTNRNKKLLDWAFTPLQRQKKLLGELDSSESDAEEDDVMIEALAEAEDCVANGRKMRLSVFKNVAQSAELTFLKHQKNDSSIEMAYWNLVLLGKDHVCVNAASIDSGEHGYGFSKGKTSCAKHPWNLKMLSANSGNVLRSLGAVLGVTVPTLHLGMVYSTSCWHRDPHGLPWIEYMHQGPSKIWYGIPNEQSTNFRKAVEALCPTSCQNKSIWLPSDILMIPPNLLREHNVSLSRVVQNPGEYIIVFPKAYSCSISTGFTVSESVYFATNSWLNTVHQVFQELRESCEPTTFSLEQLLICIAKDKRAPLSVLPLTHAGLDTVMRDELRNRQDLRAMGIPVVTKTPQKSQGDVWNVREQAECEICRATLYLSMVTGITGRSSAVCLTHALQMLQNKCGESDVTKLELVLYYTNEAAQDILNNLRNRLT